MSSLWHAVTRSTADVIDRVRAKAVSTARYLRRIDMVCSDGKITRLDAEQAYRGAFLSFHSHVENTIEYLFIGLLRGRVNHRLGSVRALVSIPSDAVATRVVFGGRRYADWLPYNQHTYDRSKLYFASGKPFTLLDKPARRALDDLTVLRNALAHESSQAIRRFREEFTNGKALPPDQRRPAGYLRGFHAVGQTRFEFLMAQTAQNLESLR